MDEQDDSKHFHGVKVPFEEEVETEKTVDCHSNARGDHVPAVDFGRCPEDKASILRENARHGCLGGNGDCCHG